MVGNARSATVRALALMGPSITESRESNRSIVLLQERAPLAMIPKRAFDSAADLEAARALIAASVQHRPVPAQKQPWLVPLLLVVVAVFVVAAILAFLA